MELLLEPFTHHGLDFTPGGIFEFKDGKKVIVDAKRYDNLSWEKYPADNIGRTKLPQNILVLDIDDSPTLIDSDSNTITIPALNNIKLPLGLYSQSARKGAYHIYYSYTQEDNLGQTFIKGLLGEKIDILMNSIVFEGHCSFSPHGKIVAGDILEIPSELTSLIHQHREEKKQSTNGVEYDKMVLHSNRQRYNLIVAYLKEEKLKISTKNALIKSIVPREYHTPFKRKKQLKFNMNELSYDLMNKVAVKLATTKELDFHEHVIPTLKHIVEEYNLDSESRITRENIKNISIGLPQHKSIQDYQIDDDNKSFQELIAAQPDTDYPIFRTITRGKVRYIRINKYSLEPVAYNEQYVLEQDAAKILNTERQQYGEDGRPTHWDDKDLPIVELVEDPYLPPYSVDKHSRHRVNLVPVSSYVTEATPVPAPASNLLLKVMRSTIHPDTLDLMLYYHAHIVFSPHSPIMIPWAASGDMVKGGSGKSMVTITILSKILQQQAAQTTLQKLASGYDMTSGVRLLTLEDSNPDMGKQWKEAYAVMKQLQSASYSKINPKYGATQTRIIKVSITGSSNSIPALSQSDRRICCIEPAWISGITDPLSQEDADTLSVFERDESQVFAGMLQEYTNHLYWLYESGTPDNISRQLYREVEPTPYHHGWTVTGISNTKGIPLTLPMADEFIASVYVDRVDAFWTGYILHILEMYNPQEQKVALSWKWFTGVIPYIARDREIPLSKKNVSAMLGDLPFPTASMWAQELQANSTLGSSWPKAVHTFRLTQDEYEKYRAYYSELISKQ